MIHEFRYEYKNVILRPLNKNDIEQLRGWRNNPDNTCYLKQIPYITPQMQIDWYKRYQNDNDEICFAIIENKDIIYLDKKEINDFLNEGELEL